MLDIATHDAGFDKASKSKAGISTRATIRMADEIRLLDVEIRKKSSESKIPVLPAFHGVVYKE